MESKEKLIKDIQFYVLNFNPYWEDPITESELVKNTIDAAESIKSYCEVLRAYHKKNKGVKDDYDKYPKIIQNTISEIVSLVSDGRDLWHKVKYEHIAPDPFGIGTNSPKEYDHHVQKNGHLDYENDPFFRITDIVENCNLLIDQIESENRLAKGADFSEITDGKHYYEFIGYENGSMDVRFDKIMVMNNSILFDGRIVYFTTYDSHTVCFPGAVVMDVDNYDISNLPYMDGDDFFEDDEFDAKGLYNCIIKHKKLTLKEVVESAQNSITSNITNIY